MTNIEKYDDPIWEFVLNSKLAQYIEPARKFWEHITDIDILGTGVFPVQGDSNPPGFMYRVTNTPVRSPIKNIQVFPFVPVAYLQITNVAGGATKMVERVCAANSFKIEEFTIIEKHNLPSTYHRGQFVAFIPTKMLESTDMIGKWVYLTVPEMMSILQDKTLSSVKQKLIKYV